MSILKCDDCLNVVITAGIIGSDEFSKKRTTIVLIFMPLLIILVLRLVWIIPCFCTNHVKSIYNQIYLKFWKNQRIKDKAELKNSYSNAILRIPRSDISISVQKEMLEQVYIDGINYFIKHKLLTVCVFFTCKMKIVISVITNNEKW